MGKCLVWALLFSSAQTDTGNSHILVVKATKGFQTGKGFNTKIQKYKQTNRQKGKKRQNYKQTNRQKYKQTTRQTDKQTKIQTGKQTLQTLTVGDILEKTTKGFETGKGFKQVSTAIC